MEATGGYEQQAFAQLSQQGLPVAILNPRAVRQFAQSMGRLEKTDAIDAGMIAWYAEVKQSPPACLAPASQQHLRALVTRLRQLTEVRTAQLNQQRLMAEMPEIGALSNKTVSKLAGVAPLAADSGQHQGKRRVRGGRGAVREILFIHKSVILSNAKDLRFQRCPA
jgi:transposase